jgi:hypothetical protein
MRFILSFIFFGLLFYAIWLYFPEAFQTLVSWVAKLFDLIKSFIETIIEKFSHSNTPQTPKSLFFIMPFLNSHTTL